MKFDHMDRRGPAEDDFGFFRALLNVVGFVGVASWFGFLLWAWWTLTP